MKCWCNRLWPSHWSAEVKVCVLMFPCTGKYISNASKVNAAHILPVTQMNYNVKNVTSFFWTRAILPTMKWTGTGSAFLSSVDYRIPHSQVASILFNLMFLQQNYSPQTEHIMNFLLPLENRVSPFWPRKMQNFLHKWLIYPFSFVLFFFRWVEQHIRSLCDGWLFI